MVDLKVTDQTTTLSKHLLDTGFYTVDDQGTIDKRDLPDAYKRLILERYKITGLLRELD